MLPPARWSLRLPRQCIRAFSSRNRPPPLGPRGSLRRTPPAQRRSPLGRPAASGQQPPSSDSPNPNEPGNPPNEPSKVEAVSNALSQVPDSENNLVTPVHIPEDPNSVLKETHPAMR